MNEMIHLRLLENIKRKQNGGDRQNWHDLEAQ